MPMPSHLCLPPALLLTLILTSGAAAAEGRIVVGQQSGPQTVERPANGQPMERVRQRFGEPGAVRAAVGDPPITVWEYPAYSVYFEYDRVIHAVLKPAT